MRCVQDIHTRRKYDVDQTRNSKRDPLGLHENQQRCEWVYRHIGILRHYRYHGHTTPRKETSPKVLLADDQLLPGDRNSIACRERNQLETVFILCTLDPTSADLLTGGIDCKPSGVEGGDGTGTARGVPFGSNIGMNTGYHGAHSFTWVEKVRGGSHKIVMRAMFGFIIVGGQNPSGLNGPKILKRTLVVQAFPV